MKKSTILFIMLSLFVGRAFTQDFQTIEDSININHFNQTITHIFSLKQDKVVKDTLTKQYQILYKTSCPFIVTSGGDHGAPYTTGMYTSGKSLWSKKDQIRQRFYNFHFCAENPEKYTLTKKYIVYTDSLLEYIAVTTNTVFRKELLSFYLKGENYVFKNGASYGNGKYLVLERYGVLKETETNKQMTFNQMLGNRIDSSYTETFFLKRIM